MAKTPEELSKELHEFFNNNCRYGCCRDEKGRLYFRKVKNFDGKKIELENEDATIPNVGGVYVFFQKGEKYNGTKLDRIVRVGIATDLNSRMRNHFNGNPANSIFARKVGFALLYEDLKKKGNKKYAPELFTEWAKAKPADGDYKKLKDEVSNYMCENFFFAFMKKDGEGARKEWEEKIISTISRDANFKCSPDWKGNCLNRGLWLEQGLKGGLLTESDIDEIKRAAKK